MKPQTENKVISGKTILFNNVTRCTFVASDTDELIQTGSRENDSHIEWAGELSIAVIVPNKCHKCDADILQKGVDFCEKCEDKPQTTPIKSAEEVLNERPFLLIGIDKFYGHQTTINAMHNFASIQTTAKEKEFCERLEELEQKIEKFNSMIIDNSEYAKGYSGGLSDCAGLVSKLKSTYNHNQQNDGE